MGLRFRKSINLGGGFKVNLSKSGIGYSWGVKGARLTKTARGTTRQTFGIPGTGISYVTESGKKKQANTNENQVNNNQAQNTDTQNERSTEIINASSYAPAEFADFLAQVNRVKLWYTISSILIWLSFFLLIGGVNALFTLLLGLILLVITLVILPVKTEYEFDEETKIAYEELKDTWMSLNSNAKFWQIITSADVSNSRAHGGAKQSVKRIPAKAISKSPFFLKTNITPFGLKLRNKQLLFLPDKLLIVELFKVGAINYSDVSIGLGTTNFIESESVPKDAHVIRQTWLKVNNNGTPDRRFKGNKQVPVCQYGEIQIRSGEILFIDIMCSNSDTIDKMKQEKGFQYMK